MNELRTHYQVSLTARQAFGLFLALLLSLGLAYFLGVLTGLGGESGRPASVAADLELAPPPEKPVPRAAPSTPVPAARAPEDSAGGAAESPVRTTIALFEDRGGGESAPPPSPPETAAPSGHFWVQVLSLSSRGEAEMRSVRLAARGYGVAVLPAQGPRGSVYRVRVGPFRTREEAARAAERLSREEKTETWIVPGGR